MDTSSIAWLMAALATATATGLVVWAGMVMQQLNDDLNDFASQQI